jgi:predicted phosphodiesterase
MKFKVASDLHININKEIDFVKLLTNYNFQNDTSLILAGDICDINFLEEISQFFVNVFFVMGNHEFYCANFLNQTNIIKEKTSHIKNLHILNNEKFIINDIMILGTTLWSDGKLGANLFEGFSDYRYIAYGNRKLNFQDTTNKFIQNVGWLTNEMCQNNFSYCKTILITHHMPSFTFVEDKFKGDELNCFFVSELMPLSYNFGVDYWVFGHSHSSTCYKQKNDIHNKEQTFIANPYGYGEENCKNFNPNMEFKL